jgi:hypothetical protein
MQQSEELEERNAMANLAMLQVPKLRKLQAWKGKGSALDTVIVDLTWRRGCKVQHTV